MKYSPVVDLACRLIRCPTNTPGDAGCQEILTDLLAGLGFTIHALPFGNVRNFYARLGNQGRNFCFAGHTDVVPPGNPASWRSPPFSGIVEEGMLLGRGAADMKGGVAAMVIAAQEFLAHHPDFRESLSFLITGDEEGDAVDGTTRVVEWLRQRGESLDFALVGEPTSLDQLGDCVKIGRRGSLSFKLTVRGKQGHVAHPHRARNPIHLAALAIAKLSAHSFDHGGQGFPPSSLQFTTLKSGGIAGNVIPPDLMAEFNIRFGTANTPETLVQQITTILTEHGLTDYTLETFPSARPFLTAPGPLSSMLSESIRTFTGLTPDLSTTGGTSDARFISTLCPQTVEFGLLGTTIHQVNESCPVADLETLTRIYQHLLERLFSSPQA